MPLLNINETHIRRRDGLMENDRVKRDGKVLPDIERERTPGEIVAAQRKKMNLTQENLEYISDVSVSHIGRIERNIVRPGLEVIEKLEHALGIPLRDAFEKYWEPKRKGKPSRFASGNALKNFERELANRRLTDEDLQRILKKVLSEADSGDEG